MSSQARRYKKKPVEISAMEYKTLQDAEPIVRWMGGGTIEMDSRDGKIVIHTLEGDMTASLGDFIIQGVQGEFYPCKPDIFEKTYDPVGP